MAKLYEAGQVEFAKSVMHASTLSNFHNISLAAYFRAHKLSLLGGDTIEWSHVIADLLELMGPNNRVYLSADKAVSYTYDPSEVVMRNFVKRWVERGVWSAGELDESAGPLAGDELSMHMPLASALLSSASSSAAAAGAAAASFAAASVSTTGSSSAAASGVSGTASASAAGPGHQRGGSAGTNSISVPPPSAAAAAAPGSAAGAGSGVSGSGTSAVLASAIATVEQALDAISKQRFLCTPIRWYLAHHIWDDPSVEAVVLTLALCGCCGVCCVAGCCWCVSCITCVRSAPVSCKPL